MNEFEVHDFIDDPNFDQFINLIRGDKEDPLLSTVDPIPDLINGCLHDSYQFPLCPSANPLDYSDTALSVNDPIPNSTLCSFSCFDGEANDRGDDSSATTTTAATISANNSKQRPNADSSKTLISERRRRGRMKQTLYALRSLVPNITKMDKASIVGDAVTYVQELQAQAKKLKTEVDGLEAILLASSQNYNQGSDEYDTRVQVQGNHNHLNHLIFCKRIMQMDVIQVEEGGFYVKVVCNKGEGVASSLYRALESLSGFSVYNSDLATLSDTFQLTLTLKVKGCEAEINLPNLKLWVTGALLNQGFQFIAYFPA